MYLEIRLEQAESNSRSAVVLNGSNGPICGMRHCERGRENQEMEFDFADARV